MNEITKESNIDSNHTIILVVSCLVTILFAGLTLLLGFVLDALFIMVITAPFFIVAFATAPLLSRIAPLKNHGAILGSILAWILAAPLGAVINTIMNKASNISDPYEFLPVTWLWALIPLAITIIVSIVIPSSNKLSK